MVGIVAECLAWREIRELTHNAISFHDHGVSVRIADNPFAAKNTDRFLGAVVDTDVIDKWVRPIRWGRARHVILHTIDGDVQSFEQFKFNIHSPTHIRNLRGDKGTYRSCYPPENSQTPKIMTPPPILTIAGSDSSCGAGVQADLKAITALGGYALNALTSVVSEIPGQVSLLRHLDVDFIVDQIRILFAGFPIAAAKSGMLGGRDQVQAVADAWRKFAGRHTPLVIDPVMVATGGGKLLEDEAILSLLEDWLPQATVITPNMDEAAVLWGRELTTRNDLGECATVLSKRFGTAVLVKGGHLSGLPNSPDVLCEGDGRISWHEAPRTRGVKTHGTGCTYSAAIAAGLGQGMALEAAVARAKNYVSKVIAAHFTWETVASGTVHALNHQQIL